MAGNLVLTPYVIHGLGVERYGIFVLVVTLTGIFSSFDGGVMGAAARYFSVYAGTDDRTSTTRLLVTFCVLLTGLGVVISAAAWFLSPVVVGLLNMSPIWRPQTVFLFRTLDILVTTRSSTRCSKWSSLRASAMPGAQRSASLPMPYTSSGSLSSSKLGGPSCEVAFIFVGQQVLASALVIPAALRYLTGEHWPCPLEQIAVHHELLGQDASRWHRQLGHNGSRLAGYRRSALSSRARDLLPRGKLRQPALVRGIECPHTCRCPPWPSVWARGEEGTLREFKRLQRLWVVAVTGWTMVGMASGYFGVLAWLGPRFLLSGWNLYRAHRWVVGASRHGPHRQLRHRCGRAGALARYGVVSMVVNIVLTVPMVLLGSLGVVAATAIGQLVAAACHAAQCAPVGTAPPPEPSSSWPLLRGAVAASITVGLEVLIRPYLPIGARWGC